ncbi:GH92 family glycosyl hydrolase [Bacteroidales bacterium OttesenSCG-928-I21]|nr:GH92 family glycosyl hydrolase [Bacteroidales bacterium OttesenSCG-928-I21]
MKKTFFYLLVLSISFFSCTEKEQGKQQDYTQFVDVFIGTGGHGHTYPGATVPHGMVQLSPDTRTIGWDACSGYHYNDSTMIGFSHTHLSGTGVPDLGDVLLLPFTGEIKKVAQYKHNDGFEPEEDTPRYGSSFSHNDESATPGYYSVVLKDYGVKAELTATTHAGFHRYTFPSAETPKLFIDLTRTMDNRTLIKSDVKAISDTEIQGFKQVGGWAPNRFIFFYAKFSQPFEVDSILNFDPAVGNAQAFLSFDPAEQVLIKVGISFVDEEGAKKNLDKEIATWDFDKIKEDAHNAWNNELSKIDINTTNDTQRTIFYTALYRTGLQPIIASDVDGRYRTMDNQTPTDTAYTNYAIFSLWDTFRSLHPLNTMISSTENQAMIRSLIRKYDEGGLLPMWELISNYTGCMIGYHAVSAIADSYFKGQRDFDIEKAYRASVRSSSYDTINILKTIPQNVLQGEGNLMPISRQYKNTQGWIPADNPEGEGESVAKGLEYAYNDWLIAQMAKDLGKKDDYNRFMALSKNYKNYYDPSVGFMRGKNTDGAWVTPFDPAAYKHTDTSKKIYCEGNAWQWAFFAPHDVDGLVELMGGKDAFTQKLDALFSTPYVAAKGENNLDITGLIGQYAHGNEPSHLTIYLYNLIGQPHKAQTLINQVLQTLYTNKPNGLSGNEDCGQMSAWYVLNAMGFHPYCPGIPEYAIGRPLFDEVKIKLENGKTFTIRTKNNSAENKYIQSATLNGKNLETMFFSQKDVMDGATLELIMTDKPN